MVLTYVVFSPPHTCSRFLDPLSVRACGRLESLLPHWSTRTSQETIRDGICLGILFEARSIRVTVLLKFQGSQLHVK